MAKKVKPRVKVPKKVKKGEVFKIKTLISHKMESGRRKNKKTGETIPRKIINTFTASFDGTPVFSMKLEPSISANPYIQFKMKAEKSGELEFKWVDDDGTIYSKKAKLTVE